MSEWVSEWEINKYTASHTYQLQNQFYWRKFSKFNFLQKFPTHFHHFSMSPGSQTEWNTTLIYVHSFMKQISLQVFLLSNDHVPQAQTKQNLKSHLHYSGSLKSQNKGYKQEHTCVSWWLASPGPFVLLLLQPMVDLHSATHESLPQQSLATLQMSDSCYEGYAKYPYILTIDCNVEYIYISVVYFSSEHVVTKQTLWWVKLKKKKNRIERKLHNLTSQEALKIGSEAWVLKEREEQRLEGAQVKFLRHLLGITKLDKEKNRCIREKREHRT